VKLLLRSQLGLDMKKFKKDLYDKSLLEEIEQDKIEGVRAGVDATPTIFINGKEYPLRHDEPFLKDILNEEAERIGIPHPFKDW
jgi:predicted DsbA family dithiol-disulfide isomerase